MFLLTIQASRKKGLGKGRPFFTIAHNLLNFMTFYVDFCDRNGHITSDTFHYYAIKSSLAKVVGLQSPFFLAHFGENERSTIFRHHKHASTDRNYIQHDRSDNISHATYYFPRAVKRWSHFENRVPLEGLASV